MRRHRTDRGPKLLAGAAAFAAAELAAALVVGGFFAWGRAEALLFFAFRPWLILVAAVLVAGWDWRRRVAFYLVALAAAGFAETLFLTALGGRAWIEMLRGWAAGLAVATVLDVVVQLGARLAGRAGRWAAAGVVLAAMLLPGGLRPYEILAIGPSGPRAPGERPPLLLLTGLPLVWGEGGAFDPASRPAAAFSALQREFEITPIDHLDARSLSGARLMLVAQPRLLEPGELVALDAWVRRGGKVLILADPDLRWPTRLPVGDNRRPPPASLLSPLLGHWGLTLDEAAGPDLRVEQIEDRGQKRRLVLAAPGRLVAAGDCRPGSFAWLATCTIGEGRALVIADADLLRDDLWIVGQNARHTRIADNPLVVAGWLDRLAVFDRERADRPVRWIATGANRSAAFILAALPILGLLAAAFGARR